MEDDDRPTKRQRISDDVLQGPARTRSRISSVISAALMAKRSSQNSQPDSSYPDARRDASPELQSIQHDPHASTPSSPPEAETISIRDDPPGTLASASFFNARSSAILIPSKDAIERARMRLIAWDKEDEDKENADECTVSLEDVSQIPVQQACDSPSHTPATLRQGHSPPLITKDQVKLSITSHGPKHTACLGTTPRAVKASHTRRFRVPFKLTKDPNPASDLSTRGSRASTGSGTQYSKRLTSNSAEKVGVIQKTRLVDCGLRPSPHLASRKKWSNTEFEAILRIVPSNAALCHVRLPSAGGEEHPEFLDVRGAALVFRSENRKFATQGWVQNAWELTLWKLSGMLLLQGPLKPTVIEEWNGMEVLRKLRRRYDREFLEPFRSPLARIVAGDASAASPIVLCISNIVWPQDSGSDLSPDAAPCIEVTDGWYRVTTSFDPPLLRAIKRGKLRMGMKLACSGAKLVTSNKEPSEILEVGDSVTLALHGNGSHLARWHCSLGFQRYPFVATLRSLTPDGGRVPLIHVLVVKIFPPAYLEVITDEDGEERTIGPWDQREEDHRHREWETRRNHELSKLQMANQAKLEKLEGIKDLISRQLQVETAKHQEEADLGDFDPDEFADETDTMGYQACLTRIKRVPRSDLLRLMDVLGERCYALRLQEGTEVATELDSLCCARKTRSFRVVCVKDAETLRRESRRIAKLTIWEPQQVFSDDSGQVLRIGRSYFFTNLQPTHPGAWMGKDEMDSEVYLRTDRSSRCFSG